RPPLVLRLDLGRGRGDPTPEPAPAQPRRARRGSHTFPRVGGAAPAFLAEEGSTGRSRRSGGRPVRPLAAVRDAAPAEPAAGALTVLLVEDDPAMQLVLSVNLEAAGFRVVPATTG